MKSPSPSQRVGGPLPPGAQILSGSGRGCTCRGGPGGLHPAHETRYTLLPWVSEPGCAVGPHGAPLPGSHLADSLLTESPPAATTGPFLPQNGEPDAASC